MRGFLKQISMGVLIFFVCTNVLGAQQVPMSLSLTSRIQEGEFSVPEKILIPREMGSVQEDYRSKTGKPFVVFIQDAHAVVDAQSNIRELIRYFAQNYGMGLVALEGGAGRLDSLLLRTFPDEGLKKKVLADYLERGELSGAQLAAALNPEDASYFGIEDWPLYEAHYLAYLKAAKNEQAVLEALDGKEKELDAERAEVYSTGHNEFHEKVKAFRGERLSLLDFLKYLRSQTTVLELMSGENYPHLRLLMDSIGEDAGLDYAMLDAEIRQTADELRKNCSRKFSKRQLMDFNEKYQEFATGRSNPAGFLKYLAGCSKRFGVKMKFSLQMKRLLGHEESFANIKGTRVFDELENLIAGAEESFWESAKEKALSERYGKIILLRDLAKLELNREKFERIQADPGKYFALIPDPALLKSHLDFYRCALARDEVLQKNLEKLVARERKNAVIVILGGFHRGGFEKRLREEGYSFCTITPRINSLAGAENYDAVMEGELSYKNYLKTTFYDAFMRASGMKLVSGLNEPDFRKVIKGWRDGVIRRLADEGRLAEAGRYTKYVDLLMKVYVEKFGTENLEKKNRDEILRAVEDELTHFQESFFGKAWAEVRAGVEDFTGKLRALADGNKITEKQVRSVFEENSDPSALGASLGALIPDLPCDWLRDFVLGELSLGDLEVKLAPEILRASGFTKIAREDVRSALQKVAKQTEQITPEIARMDEVVRGADALDVLVRKTGELPQADTPRVTQQLTETLVNNVVDSVTQRIPDASLRQIARPQVAKAILDRIQPTDEERKLLPDQTVQAVIPLPDGDKKDGTPSLPNGDEEQPVDRLIDVLPVQSAAEQAVSELPASDTHAKASSLGGEIGVLPLSSIGEEMEAFEKEFLDGTSFRSENAVMMGKKPLAMDDALAGLLRRSAAEAVGKLSPRSQAKLNRGDVVRVIARFEHQGESHSADFRAGLVYGRLIVVRKNLLNRLGMTPQEYFDLLNHSDGIREQLEGREEKAGTDGIKDPYLVVGLEKSEHLFGSDLQGHLLGVNIALGQAVRGEKITKEVEEKLLADAMTSEMRDFRLRTEVEAFDIENQWNSHEAQDLCREIRQIAQDSESGGPVRAGEWYWRSGVLAWRIAQRAVAVGDSKTAKRFYSEAGELLGKASVCFGNPSCVSQFSEISDRAAHFSERVSAEAGNIPAAASPQNAQKIRPRQRIAANTAVERKLRLVALILIALCSVFGVAAARVSNLATGPIGRETETQPTGPLQRSGGSALPRTIDTVNDGDYDLVVVGSTSSGISSAIAAKRANPNLRIAIVTSATGDSFEDMRVNGLGNEDAMRVSELRTGLSAEFNQLAAQYMLKYHYPKEPGVLRTLKAWANYDPSNPPSRCAKYAPDAARYANKELLSRANGLGGPPIILIRGSYVESVIQSENAPRVIVLGGKVPMRISGRTFVDATPSADLARKCGVQYRLGDDSAYYSDQTGIPPAPTEENHYRTATQALSPLLTLREYQGEIPQAARAVNHPYYESSGAAAQWQNFKAAADQLRARGKFPSWRSTWAYQSGVLGGGYYELNENQDIVTLPNGAKVFVGTDYLNPQDVHDYIYYPEKRPEITQRAFSNSLNWLRYHQEVMGDPIGLGEVHQQGDSDSRTVYLREGVRIKGNTTYQSSQPIAGAMSFREMKRVLEVPEEHSVMTFSYMADAHHAYVDRGGNMRGGFWHATPGKDRRGTPIIEMPYDALSPSGIPDLLVTEAVSTDRDMYAIARMEPAKAMLGQAAGNAVALSLATGRSLDKVDVSALQKMQTEQGVQVFYHDLGDQTVGARTYEIRDLTVPRVDLTQDELLAVGNPARVQVRASPPAGFGLLGAVAEWGGVRLPGIRSEGAEPVREGALSSELSEGLEKISGPFGPDRAAAVSASSLGNSREGKSLLERTFSAAKRFGAGFWDRISETRRRVWGQVNYMARHPMEFSRVFLRIYFSKAYARLKRMGIVGNPVVEDSLIAPISTNILNRNYGERGISGFMYFQSAELRASRKILSREGIIEALARKLRIFGAEERMLTEFLERFSRELGFGRFGFNGLYDYFHGQAAALYGVLSRIAVRDDEKAVMIGMDAEKLKLAFDLLHPGREAGYFYLSRTKMMSPEEARVLYATREAVIGPGEYTKIVNEETQTRRQFQFSDNSLLNSVMFQIVKKAQKIAMETGESFEAVFAGLLRKEFEERSIQNERLEREHLNLFGNPNPELDAVLREEILGNRFFLRAVALFEGFYDSNLRENDRIVIPDVGVTASQPWLLYGTLEYLKQLRETDPRFNELTESQREMVRDLQAKNKSVRIVLLSGRWEDEWGDVPHGPTLEGDTVPFSLTHLVEIFQSAGVRWEQFETGTDLIPAALSAEDQIRAYLTSLITRNAFLEKMQSEARSLGTEFEPEIGKILIDERGDVTYRNPRAVNILNLPAEKFGSADGRAVNPLRLLFETAGEVFGRHGISETPLVSAIGSTTYLLDETGLPDWGRIDDIDLRLHTKEMLNASIQKEILDGFLTKLQAALGNRAEGTAEELNTIYDRTTGHGYPVSLFFAERNSLFGAGNEWDRFRPGQIFYGDISNLNRISSAEVKMRSGDPNGLLVNAIPYYRSKLADALATESEGYTGLKNRKLEMVKRLYEIAALRGVESDFRELLDVYNRTQFDELEADRVCRQAISRLKTDEKTLRRDLSRFFEVTEKASSLGDEAVYAEIDARKQEIISRLRAVYGRDLKNLFGDLGMVFSDELDDFSPGFYERAYEMTANGQKLEGFELNNAHLNFLLSTLSGSKPALEFGKNFMLTPEGEARDFPSTPGGFFPSLTLDTQGRLMNRRLKEVLHVEWFVSQAQDPQQMIGDGYFWDGGEVFVYHLPKMAETIAAHAEFLRQYIQDDNLIGQMNSFLEKWRKLEGGEDSIESLRSELNELVSGLFTNSRTHRDALAGILFGYPRSDVEAYLEGKRSGQNNTFLIGAGFRTQGGEDARQTVQSWRIGKAAFLNAVFELMVETENSKDGFAGEVKEGKSLGAEGSRLYGFSRLYGLLKSFTDNDTDLIPADDVVADVHGDFFEFDQMLKELWARGITEAVALGDYMDRGNLSFYVYRLLREYEGRGKEVEGIARTVVPLMGNHDLMFLMAMMGDGHEFLQWLGNGGINVLKEGSISLRDPATQFQTEAVKNREKDFYHQIFYAYKHDRAFQKMAADLFSAVRRNERLREMADWMKANLRLYHLDQLGRFYVHAGVPVDEEGNSLLAYKGFRGLAALAKLEEDLTEAFRRGDPDAEVFKWLMNPNWSPLWVRQWEDRVRDPDGFADDMGVSTITVGHMAYGGTKIVEGGRIIVASQGSHAQRMKTGESLIPQKLTEWADQARKHARIVLSGLPGPTGASLGDLGETGSSQNLAQELALKPYDELLKLAGIEVPAGESLEESMQKDISLPVGSWFSAEAKALCKMLTEIVGLLHPHVEHFREDMRTEFAKDQSPSLSEDSARRIFERAEAIAQAIAESERLEDYLSLNWSAQPGTDLNNASVNVPWFILHHMMEDRLVNILSVIGGFSHHIERHSAEKKIIRADFRVINRSVKKFLVQLIRALRILSKPRDTIPVKVISRRVVEIDFDALIAESKRGRAQSLGDGTNRPLLRVMILEDEMSLKRLYEIRARAWARTRGGEAEVTVAHYGKEALDEINSRIASGDADEIFDLVLADFGTLIEETGRGGAGAWIVEMLQEIPEDVRPLTVIWSAGNDPIQNVFPELVKKGAVFEALDKVKGIEAFDKILDDAYGELVSRGRIPPSAGSLGEDRLSQLGPLESIEMEGVVVDVPAFYKERAEAMLTEIGLEKSRPGAVYFLIRPIDALRVLANRYGIKSGHVRISVGDYYYVDKSQDGSALEIGLPKYSVLSEGFQTDLSRLLAVALESISNTGAFSAPLRADSIEESMRKLRFRRYLQGEGSAYPIPAGREKAYYSGKKIPILRDVAMSGGVLTGGKSDGGLKTDKGKNYLWASQDPGLAEWHGRAGKGAVLRFNKEAVDRDFRTGSGWQFGLVNEVMIFDSQGGTVEIPLTSDYLEEILAFDRASAEELRNLYPSISIRLIETPEDAEAYLRENGEMTNEDLEQYYFSPENLARSAEKKTDLDFEALARYIGFAPEEIRSLPYGESYLLISKLFAQKAGEVQKELDHLYQIRGDLERYKVLLAREKQSGRERMDPYALKTLDSLRAEFGEIDPDAEEARLSEETVRLNQFMETYKVFKAQAAIRSEAFRVGIPPSTETRIYLRTPEVEGSSLGEDPGVGPILVDRESGKIRYRNHVPIENYDLPVRMFGEKAEGLNLVRLMKEAAEEVLGEKPLVAVTGSLTYLFKEDGTLDWERIGDFDFCIYSGTKAVDGSQIARRFSMLLAEKLGKEGGGGNWVVTPVRKYELHVFTGEYSELSYRQSHVPVGYRLGDVFYGTTAELNRVLSEIGAENIIREGIRYCKNRLADAREGFIVRRTMPGSQLMMPLSMVASQEVFIEPLILDHVKKMMEVAYLTGRDDLYHDFQKKYDLLKKGDFKGRKKSAILDEVGIGYRELSEVSKALDASGENPFLRLIEWGPSVSGDGVSAQSLGKVTGVTVERASLGDEDVTPEPAKPGISDEFKEYVFEPLSLPTLLLKPTVRDTVFEAGFRDPGLIRKPGDFSPTMRLALESRARERAFEAGQRMQSKELLGAWLGKEKFLNVNISDRSKEELGRAFRETGKEILGADISMSGEEILSFLRRIMLAEEGLFFDADEFTFDVFDERGLTEGEPARQAFQIRILPHQKKCEISGESGALIGEFPLGNDFDPLTATLENIKIKTEEGDQNLIAYCSRQGWLPYGITEEDLGREYFVAETQFRFEAKGGEAMFVPLEIGRRRFEASITDSGIIWNKAVGLLTKELREDLAFGFGDTVSRWLGGGGKGLFAKGHSHPLTQGVAPVEGQKGMHAGDIRAAVADCAHADRRLAHVIIETLESNKWIVRFYIPKSTMDWSVDLNDMSYFEEMERNFDQYFDTREVIVAAEGLSLGESVSGVIRSVGEDNFLTQLTGIPAGELSEKIQAMESVDEIHEFLLGTVRARFENIRESMIADVKKFGRVLDGRYPEAEELLTAVFSDAFEEALGRLADQWSEETGAAYSEEDFSRLVLNVRLAVFGGTASVKALAAGLEGNPDISPEAVAHYLARIQQGMDAMLRDYGRTQVNLALSFRDGDEEDIRDVLSQIQGLIGMLFLFHGRSQHVRMPDWRGLGTVVTRLVNMKDKRNSPEAVLSGIQDIAGQNLGVLTANRDVFPADSYGKGLPVVAADPEAVAQNLKKAYLWSAAAVVVAVALLKEPKEILQSEESLKAFLGKYFPQEFSDLFSLENGVLTIKVNALTEAIKAAEKVAAAA